MGAPILEQPRSGRLIAGVSRTLTRLTRREERAPKVLFGFVVRRSRLCPVRGLARLCTLQRRTLLRPRPGGRERLPAGPSSRRGKPGCAEVRINNQGGGGNAGGTAGGSTASISVRPLHAILGGHSLRCTRSERHSTCGFKSCTPYRSFPFSRLLIHAKGVRKVETFGDRLVLIADERAKPGLHRPA